MRGDHTLDVLCDHVDFDIDEVIRLFAAKIGDVSGMRNHGNGERIVNHVDNGQADAVDIQAC